MELGKISIFFVLIISIENIEMFGTLKINKLECDLLDKTFFKVNECRLRPIKRNVAQVTLRLEILQPPIKDCRLRVELLRKYAIYRPYFINITVDACEFMRNRKNYPIPSIIYGLVEKYTNINHTCPYEGEIIIEKFAPEPQSTFLPIPTGDYLLHLDWIFGGQLKLSVKYWFLFEE